MEQLKLHYENQLTSLSQKIVEPNNNSDHNNRNLVDPLHSHDKDAINIKGDLIGGERANDVQLKEKHKRKKQAAENRMRYNVASQVAIYACNGLILVLWQML